MTNIPKPDIEMILYCNLRCHLWPGKD